MRQWASNGRLTVLFVPLEPGDTGNIHRGHAMARALSWRYRVLGIRRRQGFPAPNEAIRYLKLLAYWWRVLLLGLRQRQHIDLIFCENIHAVVGAVLVLLTGKPCLWDVETESTLYMRAWRRSRLLAAVHLALERLAWPRMAVLLAPCREDRRRYLGRGFAPERVYVVPNSVDPSRLDGREAKAAAAVKARLGMGPQAPLLLFSGNRAHLPNAEAAAWINAQLAPAVAQRFPDARIILTGGGEPPSPLASNVIVVGYVPNIYEYVAAADVCLAPLWQSTGIPGKVIEYMVMGKAIVASRLVRGIPELEDGVTAMLAADGREFIDKTLYLLSDPRARETLGQQATQAARRTYLLPQVAEARLYPLVEAVAGDAVSQETHNHAQDGPIGG
ncbi:MAG: glycosyltransferase [Dehalococcoidia bacterium]